MKATDFRVSGSLTARTLYDFLLGPYATGSILSASHTSRNLSATSQRGGLPRLHLGPWNRTGRSAGLGPSQVKDRTFVDAASLAGLVSSHSDGAVH